MVTNARFWRKADIGTAALVEWTDGKTGFQGLFHFDQFDGLMAGAFDHNRADIADLIGLPQEGDAFALEFFNPSVEIGHAEPYMIYQMATRGGERPVALVWIPVHRHVTEAHTTSRTSIGALFGQRWP